MGFTTDEHMVRVDIFKEKGKWYATIALKWDRYTCGNPQDGSNDYESLHTTFQRCMKEQYPDKFKDMWAICLDPYHELSHPQMIKL